jgi:hypothetical protein
MHTSCIFDKLGLVNKKIATISRTSHRQTPRSNKNIGMQSMERIELPKMMQSSYPQKASPDSAAIYPITRSSNNHLETGKRKI